MIFFIILLLIIFIIAIAAADKKGPTATTTYQQNMDVPNPETANPKQVIEFIANNEAAIIKQVYDQLKARSIKIPQNLDRIFLEKISKKYIDKTEYLHRESIYKYQVESEDIDSFNNEYSFELQGVHVANFKKNLQACIIYEAVKLVKEPGNKYDKNAIKVVAHSGTIGRVPFAETGEVREIMGKEHKAFLNSVIDFDGFIEAEIIIHYND